MSGKKNQKNGLLLTKEEAEAFVDRNVGRGNSLI